MPKANIRVANHLQQFIGKHASKFGNIYRGEMQICNISFDAPHSNLIFIHVFNDAEWDCSPKEALEALNSFVNNNSWIQSYIIFTEEFGAISKLIDPYSIFTNPKVKLVFTNSPEAAVGYGLGLIEKAAKYGIWG